MRLDVLITLLTIIRDIHGDLPVVVSDGQSDMLWNAISPTVAYSDRISGEHENVVVIRPET